MELIYRSTMMKKLTKILCVMLIVFSVFQLVGCDKLSNLGKTEGEKADASEEENEEVTSDEKEEEKPEDDKKLTKTTAKKRTGEYSCKTAFNNSKRRKSDG